MSQFKTSSSYRDILNYSGDRKLNIHVYEGRYEGERGGMKDREEGEGEREAGGKIPLSTPTPNNFPSRSNFHH